MGVPSEQKPKRSMLLAAMAAMWDFPDLRPGVINGRDRPIASANSA